jgi:two-component system response regulator YesN
MFFKEYDASQDRGPYADHVEGAVRIIHDRYISGVTIEEAAAALGISSGHLSRIFRQETGYTFLDYLMYVRVKRAAELLRDPTVKVYEVADLVGYADARYFGQVFRKITGLTPREFRDGLSHTERTSGQE